MNAESAGTPARVAIPAQPCASTGPASYGHLFRLSHGLVLLSAPVMLVTGLANYAGARPEWTLLAGDFPRWLPSGRLQFWHLSAAVVFATGLLLNLVCHLFSRKGRGVWGLRRMVLVVLLTAGGVSLVSSLPLLFTSALGGLFTVGRALHAVSGLVVFPLALLIHLLLGLTRYRGLLIPAFHPWREARWKAVAAVVVTGLVVTLCAPNFAPAVLGSRELNAPRVQAVKGHWTDVSWREAPGLQIVVANGLGYDGGWTTVKLQAQHDGDYLYLRAEWSDPKEDRQYTPWRKTARGWERLATRKDDESVYYEDKFSLIFPDRKDALFQRAGCTYYCHYGGGRAYGYKGSTQRVDCWHWKATRSDPLDRVDDQYWLGFDLTKKNVARLDDPAESGGYKTNEDEAKTAPKWLPKDPQQVRKGALMAENAQIGSDELAKGIPEGTIVPGIYASVWKGDRGDVECSSKWADGRWVLLIRRKLNTGSAYDTAFAPGSSHPFACAAFDHTSKRHAYNHEVYSLRLAD